jgi:hypothetical protein
VIHRILQKDGHILVQASDEVKVEKVRVEIRDETSRLLEQGDAVHLEGDWWEYAPQVEGRKIIAMAWDIPGNIAKLALE